MAQKDKKPNWQFATAKNRKQIRKFHANNKVEASKIARSCAKKEKTCIIILEKIT